MKKISKRILSIVIAALLFISAPVCGEESIITIDENGCASWAPVDGAVKYEYSLVDADYTNMGVEYTTETSVALPEGISVHVRAVFEDGSLGDWMISDYFGDPVAWTNSDAVMSEPVFEEEVRHEQPKATVSIDAAGYAHWEAVSGAVKYECLFMDRMYAQDLAKYTTENTIRMPLDHCVYITPIFEDGSKGNVLVSEYYGRDAVVFDCVDPVDWKFDFSMQDAKSWNLIENINHASVTRNADGGLSFTAKGPTGDDMRFITTEGVSVEEGSITFSSGAKLYGLDAIGRILAYKPIVSDPGEGEVWINFSGGYTFDGSASAATVDNRFPVWDKSLQAVDAMHENFTVLSMMDHQPNMVGIGAGNVIHQDDYTLSELIVYYDESTYSTPVRKAYLEPTFYGTYFEGDFYDPSKERYDSDEMVFDFYLMLLPDIAYEINPDNTDFLLNPELYMSRSVLDIDDELYTIGNLKDADGNILNKDTDPLTVGCTIEVIFPTFTVDAELPVLAKFDGAENLHQLAPYRNSFSAGSVTTLVVPIRWRDAYGEANDELLSLARAKLGRIVDDNGSVTDYSPDPSEGYSLSAYYDMASYGKYHIDSYMTDWVDAPYSFEEVKNVTPFSHPMPDEIIEAVRKMYPDMDWSKFDRNGDGMLDSVIFISACGNQDVGIASFGGAVHSGRGYDTTYMGTPTLPALKDFITIGSMMLDSTNVVIHEYAHNFGIVDYYDTSYSGIDAVGGFDLQSSSEGDWNAYSKYSVGWIEPEIVAGLGSGESAEITIGSMTATGDAIVIPAAGAEFDGPFGEYILVDLYTGTGLNEYDSRRFELDDTTGVRIYHVSSEMEYRKLTDVYGEEIEIGTIHYTNAFHKDGKYLIELIQNGGKNTFTAESGNRNVAARDFFYAGDKFDMEKYGEFFVDGKMDDGSEFGYTIQVVSITGSGEDASAVIRITRK